MGNHCTRTHIINFEFNWTIFPFLGPCELSEDEEEYEEDKPLLDFLLNPTTTQDSSEVLEHNDDNQNKRGGKFKCNKCGFCYTTNQLLQSHVSSEHSSDKSRFTCSFCPITFHTKKFMLIHKQNNHPEKCHKCHICHQIYFSLRKLSSHHSSKHAGHENVNALKCSFCGKGKLGRKQSRFFFNFTFQSKFASKSCSKSYSSSMSLS